MPMLVIETPAHPGGAANRKLDVVVYDNRFDPFHLSMTQDEISAYLADNRDVVLARQTDVDNARQAHFRRLQTHARLMGLGLAVS